MINQIKEQLAFRRLKKKLRAQAQIDRAFFASARESFVALIQTKGTSTVSVRGTSAAWRYATVAIVAVLALTSGAGVFAEKLDVPPNSPLYPIKRIAEQVQLAVSSPGQQVVLHQEFAQKRAKEITTLVAEDVKPLAAAKLAAPASPEPSETPEMHVMLAPQNSLRTFSKEVVPAPASFSAPVSISEETEIHTEEKKTQLDALKNDLEKEAQQAITQSDSLQIPASARIKICMSVVNSLRSSPASSSMRLADRLQMRCQSQSRGR